jgi:hypothetical protein
MTMIREIQANELSARPQSIAVVHKECMDLLS